MFRSLVLAFALLCGHAALAQQSAPQSILVLDASGSMWGQIEGEAKITSAQRAIGELLDTLPPETRLGLIAYGHRSRGDCGDIEQLVAPAADTRETIRAAVNAIKPKGKTPLSAAVLQAAEALRYTEEAASVILLSDGLENCEMDPCALGRALEEQGIDFTAHVIGFDITDPEEQKQLSCLAEETGGRFLSAENATELTAALQQVAAAPEPVMLDALFYATDGDGGPRIVEPLVWTLTDLATGTAVFDSAMQPDIAARLAPGSYRAEVLRPSDEASGAIEVTLAPGSAVGYPIPLDRPLPTATLNVPPEAEAGSVATIGWTGPGNPRDYLTISRFDQDSGQYVNYAYVEGGSPTGLLMPPEPGQYVVRYILSEGAVELAAAAMVVTPVRATIDAQPVAEAGSTIPVGWTGPARERDYITVSAPDQAGGQYVNYTYVEAGSPLDLLMPAEPGTYEIRYVMSQDATVLASVTIEVTPVAATLDAPPQADAGSTISVGWTGPGIARDYITVSAPDQAGGQYVNYTYVDDGSPLDLLMPAEPGTYEIRYVMSQDAKVLASVAVEVTDVSATLSAAPTAAVSATIPVTWTGPAYPRDFIAVSRVGSSRNEYENYAYVDQGAPLDLLMPAEPGAYEIRYVMSQDNRILATLPIEVSAVTASVTAPPSAPAAAVVEVAWDGPDNPRDFVAVASPGDPGHKYDSYTYTQDGTPLKLQMPALPGSYEIRYIQHQGNIVLAAIPIEITPVTASVSGPPSAPAAAVVEVSWQGPDNPRDFIAVAVPGDPGHKYQNYTYTRDGTPLKLQMPALPGSYEIRYIQHEGNVVLASAPLTVTEVTAGLTAPPEAAAGATVEIGWTGPDNPRDYIAVAEPGDPGHKYVNYTYTKDGSPLRLVMPPKPGGYEIRYIQHQGSEILARVPISLSAVDAALSAPPAVPAGSQVEVSWSGPAYDRDYISIAEAGEPGHKYLTYTYVKDGSPLKVQVPGIPARYELRYVQHQGSTILAAVPLEVTAVTATLEAAPSGAAGTPFPVTWTGPGNPRDYLAVSKPDDPVTKSSATQQVANGNPAQIRLPKEPGTYEIRYILHEDRQILARIPVTVQ